MQINFCYKLKNRSTLVIYLFFANCYSQGVMANGEKSQYEILKKIEYAGKIINIPKQEKKIELCELNLTNARERALYNQKERVFKNSGNQLLLLMYYCPFLEKIRSGKSIDINDLPTSINFTMYATLDENNKKLSIPGLTRELFLRESVTNYENLSLDKIFSDSEKEIAEYSKNLFKDEEVIKNREPLNLGVLSVGNAIHMGIVSKVSFYEKSLLTLTMLGSTVVKEVLISFAYVAPFEGKESTRKYLRHSEIFSTRFVDLN